MSLLLQGPRAGLCGSPVLSSGARPQMPDNKCVPW
ncbi:hypothetical protein LEMLEM_LOCUS14081 [Lemmus lemmus]